MCFVKYIINYILDNYLIQIWFPKYILLVPYTHAYAYVHKPAVNLPIIPNKQECVFNHADTGAGTVALSVTVVSIAAALASISSSPLSEVVAMRRRSV